MTFPTHLLAGLIIGKITGNYTAALTGSLLIDLDHSISYFKNGILFKPKALIKAITDEEDPWGDQRNFFHGIFGWFFLSVILVLINFKFGLVFSIAHFFHLIFDAMDSADFYPLFPIRKFDIRGFINYYSKKEFIFDFLLILFLATLFIY